MVHPSTGYMVARALAAVPALGDAIVEQLSQPGDRANSAPAPLRATSEAGAMEISEKLWESVWPGWRLRQREFFTFGMDVLLTLDLEVRIGQQRRFGGLGASMNGRTQCSVPGSFWG